MDFEFSEDQRAVADLAEAIFRDHGTDEHIGRIYAAVEPFDASLWQSLAEAGFLAAIIPSECGGSGLGMLDLSLLLERQGASIASAPLWRHTIASLAIASFGDETLKQRLLPALCDGSAIASISAEPNSWSSVSAVPCAAGWSMTGTVCTVTMNRRTDVLVLPARLPNNAIGMFVVRPTDPAIKIIHGVATNYEAVADLTFDNFELTGDSLLNCKDPTNWLTPRAALAVAALQLGVTSEALKRTAAYVGEREQFGRAIGTFQAVAMRMADAYIQLELLRTAIWQLGWRLDQGLPVEAAARVAKYQAGEAGHMIGHVAQHYHGGVGADTSYPIHRFFLWSKALDLAGGGAEWQIEALAQKLPDQIGSDESLDS
ncbi:MAG: acyl-CoA dehydrogenase family protein [Novosphingobium sp.]